MMENNEDKRMTVIAAEIERQKSDLAHFEKLELRNPNGAIDFAYMIKSTSDKIAMLESLLEPEKEALIDFAAAYQKEVYYNAFDKSPRTYFSETYTQQTK